jgi:transcriptional regulator with XRE-family HTH domain
MKDEFEKRIAAETGAAIKARRLECGLSQDQLAERLDVGPEAVSRMERGVVMLTIPKLVELANALDCPIETFIPQASGSTLSGANEVAQMLKPLNAKDAQFVVELLGKVGAHLARR